MMENDKKIIGLFVCPCCYDKYISEDGETPYCFNCGNVPCDFIDEIDFSDI